MSARLTVVLFIALLAYFIIILSLLKYRKIDLKYALVWLFTGLCLVIIATYPHLLNLIRKLLGITSNMNALYVCILAFIFLILLSLTSITSGQKERIRRLAEENGILEKRVRDLEKQLEIIKNTEKIGVSPSKSLKEHDG